MAKRVWCISKYASPPRYGVGARLYYIAKEFGRQGFEVLLISSDSNHLANYPESSSDYNFEEDGNIIHLWIKTYKYMRSASLKRMLSWLDFEVKLFKLKLINLGKPDVVIVSSLSLLTIVYGLHLKHKFKCKLVFEIRDIHPLTLTEEFGVSKWHPVILMLGFLERLGYKHSDLIVGTMPNLKQHVQELMGKAYDVMYSPIGIHEIWNNEVTKNSEIDQLFLRSDAFVVGYAGSMGQSNALGPFIDAIKYLSNDKRLNFVIVGEGDLKEKYIAQLKGCENVTIGPKISQKNIPYFLSRCDVLYLSTHNSKIWDYGQSMNKMIDYMMAGKPVIASYTGFPSMLNEANAGIFVPVDNVDAIIQEILHFRLMDSNERKAYGQRGREWVMKNHSYSKIASDYGSRIMSLFDI